MKLTEIFTKMPTGRRFKRQDSEYWLKLYEDNTIRKAGSGKGPKKVHPLTIVDMIAEDWDYEHTAKPVTRSDLVEAGKFVAKETTSQRLSPVEIAKLISDQLELD